MKVGDRIELVAMPDDPDPVLAGTQGEVLRIDEIRLGSVRYRQVLVKWDNGRSLGLCVPPDVVRVLTTQTPTETLTDESSADPAADPQ